LNKLPDNIVVGEPLVSLKSLGITDKELTVYEDQEVFIPRILKKYGFFKSTGEIKRNKPELWRELKFPDFLQLSFGHKRVCIITGK